MSLANKGDQIHPQKIPLNILNDSVRESFPDDLGSGVGISFEDSAEKITSVL